MKLFVGFVSGVIDDPEFSGGNVAKGASGDTSSNIAKSAFGKLPRISGSLKILASDTIKNTAGTANAIASQVKGPWKNSRFVNGELCVCFDKLEFIVSLYIKISESAVPKPKFARVAGRAKVEQKRG